MYLYCKTILYFFIANYVLNLAIHCSIKHDTPVQVLLKILSNIRNYLVQSLALTPGNDIYHLYTNDLEHEKSSKVDNENVTRDSSSWIQCLVVYESLIFLVLPLIKGIFFLIANKPGQAFLLWSLMNIIYLIFLFTKEQY